MNSKKDIKAAVELLDPKNDLHWNADGSPSLKVLQEALGPELTVEQVNDAVGKDGLEKFARGRGVIVSLPEPEEPNEISVARQKTTEARAAIADLDAKIEVNTSKRIELDRELDQLTTQKDAQIRQLAVYSPKVSDADAVKAIQRQTIEQNKKRIAALAVVQGAASAAGIGPQYPSVLDQRLANRPRTPDHAKNMATYVHQNAVDRNAARG